MHDTEEVNIDGVVLTGLAQIVDERGAVLHMIRADSNDFMGFGKCYFSEVLPGKIKAWKLHKRHTQNLVVPVGTVRIVLYDVREHSKTHGVLREILLGRPKAYYRLTIPPGIWYGFACVGKSPALLANCTDFPHDKSESEACPLDDTRIPFSWQMDASV